jgi:flagellar basal-body rod modification protein FlgD
MSIATTTSPSAASIAAAASTGTTGSVGGSTATSAASAATSSLAGNFNTFLTLLTTQLQNQDPTSPMDTNQFTSQLVEFAGVEQQINTNTNLTTLINLTQASSLYQSSAMVGHQVSVTSSQLALQGGSAGLQYTLTTPQPVNVAVTNAAGVTVYQATLNGSAGANSWTWNGVAADGTKEADGAYGVSVTTAGVAPQAIPFTVIGTATGVTMNSSTPSVSLGPLSVPMSSVDSIVN